MVEIRVETVELGSDGTRQISPIDRATEFLRDRKQDLLDTISEISSIVSETTPALANSDTADAKFGIASMELSFGLTLTADAGVIVSKVGAEATFEVTVTVDRKPK